MQFIKSNILTFDEVCELLQISRNQLSKIEKSGKLIPMKNSLGSNFYLRSDVEEYTKKHSPKFKAKVKSEYRQTTTKSLEFFNKHISNYSEIDSIYIYFNEIDAILSGFHKVSESLSEGKLKRLEVPHFVIRDVDGNELWLSGCNCGYVGESPRGSETILKSLAEEGKIKLNPNDTEIIFNNRVINIFINEDKSADILRRRSIADFGNESETVKVYDCGGRTVMLQSYSPMGKSIKNKIELSTLEKYCAFIPNPVKAKCFLSDEHAEANDYLLSAGLGCTQLYKMIISDASGRELWFDPFSEFDDDSSRRKKVKNILDVCGLVPKGKSRKFPKLISQDDEVIYFEAAGS